MTQSTYVVFIAGACASARLEPSLRGRPAIPPVEVRSSVVC
jgi:hypothetical protein